MHVSCMCMHVYVYMHDVCGDICLPYCQAKKLVESLLSSYNEDIDNKISYFVDKITERVSP